MKNALRFLTTATLVVAFTAVIAITTFAQTDEEKIEADKRRLYNETFIGNEAACAPKAPNVDACNYKTSDKAKRKAAYDAAREYVKKYDVEGDSIITFLKKRIDSYDKEIAREALFNRFNVSLQKKDLAESFASGKLILAAEPNLLDIEIILASLTFTNPAVTTFNAESISYAKSVIQKLESGKTSEKFGDGDFVYRTKENTLGEMNYIIGTLLNAGRKEYGKDTLEYYTKAQKVKGSDAASDSEIDRAFGSWYLAEFNRLQKSRIEKLELAKNIDTEETDTIEAMQKGYAERAIDAYTRANDKAKKQAAAAKEAADKEYYTKRASDYYKIISTLYNFRFDKDKDAVVPAKDIETYMGSFLAKPAPDFNTAVAPVVKAPPVVVPPTTTPTTVPTKPTTAPTTMPTKPATTTPATTTPAKPAVVKPAAKPTAKKPVVKKKV